MFNIKSCPIILFAFWQHHYIIRQASTDQMTLNELYKLLCNIVIIKLVCLRQGWIKQPIGNTRNHGRHRH